MISEGVKNKSPPVSIFSAKKIFNTHKRTDWRTESSSGAFVRISFAENAQKYNISNSINLIIMQTQTNANKKKPPLTYYGGKQQLMKTIIDLIPEHRLYTEVFFGGGAIYFAKEPCQSVINDINNNLINFYRQLKTNNKGLLTEIEATLYSQEEHRIAKKIYFDKLSVEDMHFSPDKEVKIKKALAVYVLAHQSYLSILGNTWNFSVGKRANRGSIHNNPNRFNQKKLNMVLNDYADRLQNTSIFNDDALKVLRKSDSEDTFHYIDPPYYNSNMGHYGGYALEDFENLLRTCSELKGKFVLSSYPSDILTEYVKKNNWKSVSIDMFKSAGKSTGLEADSSRKVEVLTMNF